MHLSFLTRGHIEHVNRFINELSTRYLDFNWFNPQTKQMEKKRLQMRVCPIQLWDISFPVDQWDAVATTVLGKKDSKQGKPEIKSQGKFLYVLRKAMKQDKIPEYDDSVWLNMDDKHHIEVLGIGVKEDKWITENGGWVDEKNKTELSYEGI